MHAPRADLIFAHKTTRSHINLTLSSLCFPATTHCGASFCYVAGVIRASCGGAAPRCSRVNTDGWVTCGDQAAWDLVGRVGVEGRVHPRVARRESKVTEIPAEGGLDQTFTHPHPSLLLSLFHQKTFLCTLIRKSEINKAGTHLNKCAEMPADSRTPSDRQASFKSTPQSTQNAFWWGWRLFHPTTLPRRRCEESGRRGVQELRE